MAAPAVGAALKKAAVCILTDKKALKTAGGIVCGIIVIIIMPIAALLGIFNGTVEIDTEKLHQMISENQSAMEEKWSDVETAMTDAGYDSNRIEEARTLYVFALSSYVEESYFADRLVGCFTAEQTNEDLIIKVNEAFGTNIKVEDFKNAMENTRNDQKDADSQTDSET